ncbi:MAG TPA: RsmB/NOP family class I SAM-dependent RNA methyltransferase [Candidatus Nanopusillus sp.]|nr:RsmB/NOP family class I SAM-dependent RNA methyltransferase [Candidatus Nanopusillus sp.]
MYTPKIKKSFEKHYKELLGEDKYGLFLDWSLKALKKSIRINTIKIRDDISFETLKEIILNSQEENQRKKLEKVSKNIDRLYKFKPYPFKLNVKATDILKRLKEQGWELCRIPFYKYGFWVEHPERRDVGNTIEFQLGYYYSQEAASMIPPIALDPKPGELILDMAAAPGSKTTQIAMHMENKGCIIANDVDVHRISALAENLQKQGVTNTIITKLDGRRFKYLGIKFDKILLDTPCSGTGAIRKSYKTLEIWNINMIKRLSKLQRELILSAFDSLKEGGILVYSTCSVEPDENEFVVNYLLEKRENAKIEKIKIPNLKKSEPFLEWRGIKFYEDIKYTIRLWPWNNDTEGFYIAKIKKS